MNKFVKKALDKIDKLGREQIKKILSNLSVENELLETVLYSLDHGVIVPDISNRILFINKASKRLIPFKQTEILGEKVWDVVDDREISSFLRESLMRKEKVIEHEFTLGNGHARIIICSLLPLVKDKKVQGTLIHIEDVTEKRTREARLRRAESLAALTTLTAGVAHEIKNPLGSIGIYIQLIQKQIRQKTTIETKDIKEYLNVINEEIVRLNKVVLDFLFAVRPMDTKPELKDMNLLIKELLQFLRYELEQAHVAIEVSLGEIPRIELDEKFIKQALLNIIQNALYAMPRGGVLSISTFKEEEKVLVEISDTGSGIPEDIIDKIFEPYFTTKDHGSGLGLTLVYKIVKEHLGDVFVHSKEGKGSAFTLSFPIPQEETRLLEMYGERENE